MSTMSISELKDYVKTNISAECKETIYKGTDVELSIGKTHFTFDDEDQRNIQTAYDISRASGVSIPYHADGEECQEFSKNDIVTLYFAMQNFITYNLTYCNMLKIFVKNETSRDIIVSIKFGTELQGEYKAKFDTIIANANTLSETLKGNLL